MKKFDRLKVTEIQPTGWLLDQLKIQMKGLSGKLYEIWDSVGSYSGWLGGTGESWERAPYYLDGLVPLSYYLEDQEHWELCCRFIEWTLNSQDETGNFGPVCTKHEQWSRYAMLKVLIQYEEITGDERVLPFVEGYLRYMAMLVGQTEIKEWSRARIPDLLYVGKWLYDRTGKEEVLEYMRKIDSSSLDWCDFLENLPFPRPASYYFNWKAMSHMYNEEIDRMAPYHLTHIVNVTMGFKHPAMRALLCHDRDYGKLAKEGIEEVIRRHGVASGCINGDEHLAGNNPTQGSELCSVVEYMFSLQALMEVFGDSCFGDWMERLAYNALPATITEDFMGHQYLQQANQIIADNTERPWFNNDSDSNMFGLEPNFGCCTANMHQGWPKFVNALWYRENDETLVSMVFAPNAVSTVLGGEKVTISLETQYPFRDRLCYCLEEAPTKKITVKIRIPGWCKAPEVQCEGAKISCDQDCHFIAVEKQFSAGDRIEAVFAMPVSISDWYHGSVAVERGPLVYGLDIRERWEAVKEACGVKDYSVYPESPWNYAICREVKPTVEEQEVSNIPFSKNAAPVRIKLAAKRLESWKVVNGNTGEMPASPVMDGGEEEEVTLIPFGCTKLRVSQFPYYSRS